MNLDREMSSLAEGQHGLVASYQAYDLGMTKQSLSRRRGAPDWEAITANVLRRVGSPATPAQRAMAAVLDTGPDAWLSHLPAAAWWDLPGPRLEPLHVTRRKGVGRRRSELCVVHEMTDIERRHVTILNGVQVVRPELLAYQLFGSLHPLRAERLVESAWRHRLLSGRSIRRVLGDLAEQGRNGTTALRDYLDRRGDNYVPAASNLEARFEQILRDAGESPMRRQVDAGDETEWIGRVDFADEELPLLVEIQSEKYHAALCDKEHDRARLAALRAAGFKVLEFTDHDVWHRRSYVLAEVRAARRRWRQRYPPAA